MDIQTQRCTIRGFVADDIDSFMEYHNNLEWMRYQGFKGRTKEAYEADLLTNTSLADGRQFAIINTADGQLIGDIYVKQEDGVYWLGYTIHPLQARRGFAKEAVGAMIKWIGECGGTVIKAGVLPDNIASINLLEQMKFTYLTKENDELIYTYKLQET